MNIETSNEIKKNMDGLLVVFAEVSAYTTSYRYITLAYDTIQYEET